MKTEELKSHDLVDIQDYRGEVYLKTDVDKYIAKLKGDGKDEKKKQPCFYCEHPGGVVLNAPMSCFPYEAIVHFNDLEIQTTDDQTVNICTIRGIKFCPMCGRDLRKKTVDKKD